MPVQELLVPQNKAAVLSPVQSRTREYNTEATFRKVLTLNQTDADPLPTKCTVRLICEKRYWFQAFPFRQFHVLFNSLFKVLFIFPSRYLFAIDLSPIFSFRWYLPPILHSIPKLCDSSKTYYTETGTRHNGTLTLYGAAFQRTCAQTVSKNASRNYNSHCKAARFQN